MTGVARRAGRIDVALHCVSGDEGSAPACRPENVRKALNTRTGWVRWDTVVVEGMGIEAPSPGFPSSTADTVLPRQEQRPRRLRRIPIIPPVRHEAPQSLMMG